MSISMLSENSSKLLNLKSPISLENAHNFNKELDPEKHQTFVKEMMKERKEYEKKRAEALKR